MIDVQQALKQLRDKIAQIIANLETWATLDAVCSALSLPQEDSTGLSKYTYLRQKTAAASEQLVIEAAKQILTVYPGLRESPSDSDCQELQDCLWWIETKGEQRLSNVLRYQIAEQLEGVRFWGRHNLRTVFTPVLPQAMQSGTLPDIGSDGHLYRGLLSAAAESLFFKTAPLAKPMRLLVVDYFRQLGLEEWHDHRFCLLLERLVHPAVQPAKNQQQLVQLLNQVLQQEGFELRQEGAEGGLPIYRVRRMGSGVAGAPKYILFAAAQAKPDIVIDDAVNMDIRVVNQSDCLVYDEPPTNSDLTWRMLVDWWVKSTGFVGTDSEQRHALGQQLQASMLGNEAELMLFSTYFRAFHAQFGNALPALLPQVYLHYDPRQQSQRGKPVVARQRMDFLLLLRHATRIVIEVDGKQHYANESGQASPAQYAQMVAEDRRIKLLGYEVYRFGGLELVEWNGEKFVPREGADKTVRLFFEELFSKHDVRPSS